MIFAAMNDFPAPVGSINTTRRLPAMNACLTDWIAFA
jgi:hypothetical protein